MGFVSGLASCECGCGLTVNPGRSWIKGHNRRKPKPARVVCGCGCGELAGQGKRFIQCHHSRVMPAPMTRPEIRAKVSAKLKGRPQPWQRGERNFKWRGDDVGYYAAHTRVARRRPKTGICEKCGAERLTHLAYKGLSGWSGDPGDYWELCVPCHSHYDRAKKKVAVA